MGGLVDLRTEYKELNSIGYNSIKNLFLIFSIFITNILHKYQFTVNWHKIRLKCHKSHTQLSVVLLLLALVIPPVSALSNTQDLVVPTADSLRLIEEEFENGTIDLDQYILYKAFATFKPEKFTQARFFSSSIKEDSPPLYLRKCGTPVLLEIKDYWNQLSSGTREQLEWINLRPTEPGGDYPSFEQHKLPQLYSTQHFVVHYTRGDDGGYPEDAPNLSDSNNNGVPDYIEDVGKYFEDAYEFSISMGFEPPVDDSPKRNDDFNSNPDERYDIFVYNLGAGFYGVTYAEQYPNTPSYSFISINNNYDWALPNDDPEGYIKGALKITAAHEFHHAIQFCYDVNEEAWWYEATSTYFEDEVYPQVNDNYNFIGKYFDSGNHQYFEHIDQYSLNKFNGWHEYGSFIFVKKLSEDMGDNLIRKIWEECRYTNGISAINKVLIGSGSNFYLEFINFTRANYFLEEYEDGEDYRNVLNGNWNPDYGTTFNGPYIEYKYDYSSGEIPFKITSQMLNRDSWMAPWSADYVELKLNPSENYRIFFNGLDNSTTYIVGLAYIEDSRIIEEIFTLDGDKDGFSDISGKENAVLIIMNAGQYSTKNPSWEVTITRKTAVTIGGKIADILDKFGHEYVEIGISELEDYERIKMYDTIFIDPNIKRNSIPLTANLNSSINKFVENGGVLFAPCNASEVIRSSFPENVNFHSSIDIEAATVEGKITDFGFSTYTGKQNITLHYNENASFVESLKGRYRAYILGDVYFNGWDQKGEGSADLINVPIVGSFKFGNGIVVYSSLPYLNGSINGDEELEENMTRYIILVALTEKLAMANEEMLRNEGYLFFKDIRGAVEGSEIVEYSYSTKDEFKVILNWENSESELGLALFVNDEFFEEVISKGPPSSILVENASSKYTYMIRGSEEPITSTEYVLTIGEIPFQATLLSPTNIIILFISLTAVCVVGIRRC